MVPVKDREMGMVGMVGVWKTCWVCWEVIEDGLELVARVGTCPGRLWE